MALKAINRALQVLITISFFVIKRSNVKVDVSLHSLSATLLVHTIITQFL